MTKRERLRAAIRGDAVDRPPVALWRHFPTEDARAETLARAHVEFYRAYDWDFLKVTPANGYYGDDWGLRAGYKPNPVGARRLSHSSVHRMPSYKPNPVGARHIIDRPIKKGAEWPALRRLDVTAGGYGRELHALHLIRRDLREDVILATVFSPLTIARTLSGDQALVRYLREEAEHLHAGLAIITDVTRRFTDEALNAGADGIFFATQCATTDYLTQEEYEEFGRPYDLQVLDAAMQAEVRLLHLHGQHVMFDLVTDYPVDIVNWHDRHTPPSLRQARERFSGCLAGGIEEWEVLAKSDPAAVTAQVRDAVEQTGGRRLIVAAGCTILITTPEPNLRAARAAVES